MKRIRLIIQYEGTHYVGWQTQPNGPSVQARMEAELSKLCGAKTALHASGRTDSGVHAFAQVAHFDTESRIPAEKWAYALNAGLPADIRVAYSGEAAPDFHARFDVKRKHYRYRIQLGPHADPFLRRTALHVHGPLDLRRMEEAAALLVGTHDFSAFKAAGVELQSTVRTLFSSAWKREGRLLSYTVSADGFMYNMVRILVGTMLEIGMGRREADSISRALLSGNRAEAGATAPAQGLTLARVEYADFDTDALLCIQEGQ